MFQLSIEKSKAIATNSYFIGLEREFDPELFNKTVEMDSLLCCISEININKKRYSIIRGGGGAERKK